MSVTSDQIDQIVDIHMSVLSKDLLPQMGKTESILIKEIDGKVAAFCVVSYDSKNILRRVLKHTFFPFLCSMFYAVFNDWKFLTLMVKIMFNFGDFENKNPEIAFLCTHKHYQGKGIGSELLETARKNLKDQGYCNLYVKTINQPENLAIRFYTQNGFVAIENFVYAGIPYQYFMKVL